MRASQMTGVVALVAVGLTGCSGSPGKVEIDKAAAAADKAVAAPAYEKSPVGWAGRGGGTTGGAKGATVTVSTVAGLKKYATAKRPFVIKVKGTIALAGMQKIASNKTIIGIGVQGRITGGGLSLSGVRNVVIRNLTFTGSPDDAISVQGSRNVWIDHNDLSKAFDGLTDVKRGSDYVTISWNRYHDHNKTALLGHSDSAGSLDKGHLRATYVHNWFDGTTQRHPRVRFANPVHVFNNYFNGNSGYGVASTEGAGVLVERNFFENVKRPTSTSEGSSGPGNIRLLGNYFLHSGRAVKRNPAKVAAIPYAYTPQTAKSVKATVTAGAGVGHIG
jgi:pectate lyase